MEKLTYSKNMDLEIICKKIFDFVIPYAEKSESPISFNGLAKPLRRNLN